ncbi:MAG TPA: NHL repeat-containing protein [bacterium]|nr:NHL repeat-containing protein [bacterium]
MRIGDREVSAKEMVLGVILALVAGTIVWVMLKKAPAPKIGQPGFGLVLMQGGQPGAGKGQFAYPRGAAINGDGDVYIADSRNNRVERFRGSDWQFLGDFGGLFDAMASTKGDAKKLATEALGKLHEPNGIAIGPDDTVYVADTWNYRVQVFTKKGKAKFAFAADDGFFAPRELVVDPMGNCFVADTGKHRIVKFDKNGKKIKAFGSQGDKEGMFNEPIGLALDQAGNLYVADRINQRIEVFSGEGQFIRQFPAKWVLPFNKVPDGKHYKMVPEQIDIEPHLALDKAHGVIYASDGKGKKVLAFKLDGTPAGALDNNSNGAPLFNVPVGVAVDKDGNLLVVDAGAGRLVKVKGLY